MDEEWIAPVFREHQPLFTDFMLLGQGEPIRITHSLDAELGDVIKVQGVSRYYDVPTQISMRREDYRSFMDAMKRENKKTGDFFERYGERVEHQSKRLLMIADGLNNNPVELTDNGLVDSFSAYSREAILQASFLFGVRAAQDVIAERLETELSPRLTEEEWQDVFTLLCHPSEDHPLRARERELMHLASLIRSNSKFNRSFRGKPDEIWERIQALSYVSIRDGVSALIRTYPWEILDYFSGRPYNPLIVIGELKARIEYQSTEMDRGERHDIEERYSALLSRFRNYPAICRFSNLSRKFAYLRDRRMQAMLLANGSIYEMLSEIGKRTGTDCDGLLQLRHDEILGHLTNGDSVDQDLIHERREGYAAVLEDGHIDWYSGNDLHQIIPMKIMEGKLKVTDRRKDLDYFLIS